MSEQHLLENNQLGFIMAGNAIVTLRSKKTGVRYTFKVRKAKENPNYEQAWFVGFLMGQDNENDYMPMGIINVRNGVPVFRLEKRTTLTFESAPVVSFTWTLKNLIANTVSFGVEIFHSGTCGRCGRTLTVPESIITGLGPECATKGFGF